jgi:hypothetical protein
VDWIGAALQQAARDEVDVTTCSSKVLSLDRKLVAPTGRCP